MLFQQLERWRMNKRIYQNTKRYFINQLIRLENLVILTSWQHVTRPSCRTNSADRRRKCHKRRNWKKQKLEKWRKQKLRQAALNSQSAELIVKVEAILLGQRHSQLHVWHCLKINLMSFVQQLQQSCWKDEQERLPEDESGDEQIVDAQSDKAGESSGYEFMAARNKTIM